MKKFSFINLESKLNNDISETEAIHIGSVENIIENKEIICNLS
jgi:hypothetical protein